MSAPVNNEAQAPIEPVAAAPVTETKAPAAAPAAASTGGPIDQDDLKRWTDRANDILARPSEHLNSSSAPGAQPWYAGFFDCFNPVDSCLITCCVPCVTFGKAHHRIHKDPSLKGYEPVNTSCLLLCASGCVGCFCVPIAVQSQMMREKYHLEGSCVEDLLKAWCCGCCTLIQQDKEAEYRETLLRQAQTDSTKQYQASGGMSYPAQ